MSEDFDTLDFPLTPTPIPDSADSSADSQSRDSLTALEAEIGEMVDGLRVGEDHSTKKLDFLAFAKYNSLGERSDDEISSRRFIAAFGSSNRPKGLELLEVPQKPDWTYGGWHKGRIYNSVTSPRHKNARSTVPIFASLNDRTVLFSHTPADAENVTIGTYVGSLSVPKSSLYSISFDDVGEPGDPIKIADYKNWFAPFATIGSVGFSFGHDGAISSLDLGQKSPSWTPAGTLPTKDTPYNALAVDEQTIFLFGGPQNNCITRWNAQTGQASILRPIPASSWLGNFDTTKLGSRIALTGLYNSMLFMDPREEKWSQGPGFMKTRYGAGMVVMEGKLYAVGGYVEEKRSVMSIEVLEERTNKWMMVPAVLQQEFGYGVCAAIRI